MHFISIDHDKNIMTDDDDQWQPLLSRASRTEQREQSSDPQSHAVDSCYMKGPPFTKVPVNTSRGINPSSFYKKSKCSQKTRAEEKLEHLFKLSSQNEIVQMRREFSSKQKIKQDAYDSVTSFRIFPLQELAMKFLDELINEYRGAPSTTEKSKQSQFNTSKSFVEVRGCKRRRKDCKDISLNEVRDIYVSEFLKERNFRPLIKQIPSESKEEIQGLDELRENEIRHIPNKKFTFLPLMWSMEPRIFAMETSSTGKRKYIVGNLGRFFSHYWTKSDPRARHYYELIREGANVRLYFDLEFCKKANPQITPDESEALMREFIEELSIEFRRTYNIVINRTCIVDLDSSTKEKFSRHLIVHLPNGQLFSNAQCAGIFVKRFVGRLVDALSTGSLVTNRPTLSKYLFINSQAPKTFSQLQTTSDPKTVQSGNVTLGSKDAYRQKSCFVDLGVYTRNRLFRLMGSSKFGKDSSAALRIAASNEFPFRGFSNANFYVPAQVSNSVKTISLSDISLEDRTLNHEKFCAAMNWDGHAEALASTLVVPANASKIDFPILTVVENSKSSATQQPTTTSPFLISHPPKTLMKSSTGVSPIPSLDHFVLTSLGNRGGVQGRIRTWSMDCIKREGRPVTHLMTYQMCENRWCENIGRSHKSNNVMWTVDLTEKRCWQSCHDPDCRITGFRGRPINLPYDIAADIDDHFLDQELAQLDENQIIENAKSNTRRASTGDNLDESEFDRGLCAVDMSSIKPVKFVS